MDEREREREREREGERRKGERGRERERKRAGGERGACSPQVKDQGRSSKQVPCACCRCRKRALIPAQKSPNNSEGVSKCLACLRQNMKPMRQPSGTPEQLGGATIIVCSAPSCRSSHISAYLIPINNIYQQGSFVGLFRSHPSSFAAPAARACSRGSFAVIRALLRHLQRRRVRVQRQHARDPDCQ